MFPIYLMRNDTHWMIIWELMRLLVVNSYSNLSVIVNVRFIISKWDIQVNRRMDRYCLLLTSLTNNYQWLSVIGNRDELGEKVILPLHATVNDRCGSGSLQLWDYWIWGCEKGIMSRYFLLLPFLGCKHIKRI